MLCLTSKQHGVMPYASEHCSVLATHPVLAYWGMKKQPSTGKHLPQAMGCSASGLHDPYGLTCHVI